MITVQSNGRIYIDGKKSNFYVYEFVTPETWAKWGIKAIRYIEEAIILGAQFLRTESGLSVTVCNHVQGGTYRDSGTRTHHSYLRMYASRGKDAALRKYLNTYSMHKYHGAGDLKIGKMTSHEMADMVHAHAEELMEIGIRRIENPDKTQSKHGKLGRDWLHMDTAIAGLNYILQVNP